MDQEVDDSLSPLCFHVPRSADRSTLNNILFGDSQTTVQTLKIPRWATSRPRFSFRSASRVTSDPSNGFVPQPTTDLRTSFSRRLTAQGCTFSVAEDPTANNKPNKPALAGTGRRLRDGTQVFNLKTIKPVATLGTKFNNHNQIILFIVPLILCLTECPSPARTRSNNRPRRDLPKSPKSPQTFVKPSATLFHLPPNSFSP